MLAGRTLALDVLHCAMLLHFEASDLVSRYGPSALYARRRRLGGMTGIHRGVDMPTTSCSSSRATTATAARPESDDKARGVSFGGLAFTPASPKTHACCMHP